MTYCKVAHQGTFWMLTVLAITMTSLQEECRGWDINETVFSPGMWELYQPLLRADFSLFDEYQPSISAAEATAAPFQSRLCLFWGQHDRRVTEAMVQVSDCTEYMQSVLLMSRY